jgi:hypothetical protein
MRERRQQPHEARAAAAECPEILIQFCRQLISSDAIFIFRHRGLSLS